MISEPIPFLANIILVAHADGKLSPYELKQLEEIRTELKIKKSDFNGAIRLVEQGNHKLTPIGSFADQVKNLELMLRVALADDDLDKAEASLLIEFCKAVGIMQNQLNKIKGDVLDTLKQQGQVCPSCGASADSCSRFCSKCGTSFKEPKEEIQVNLAIPNSGLAIEFSESTAASFPKAMEAAKASNGFQSCQKNKKNWYLAVYNSGDFKEALPLVEALSGIRNRSIYIDGQRKDWNEVFGFAWCAAQRSTAYQPDEYCFGKDENRLNPWGCKQADMDWTDWAKWFQYGSWEKTGLLGRKIQWRFDKKKIRHELNSNLHRYRFCPHINMKLGEAIIKYLPETINPESDPNWGFHEQYDQSPGSIKVVEEKGTDEYSYKNEFWADGVHPRGLQLLSDILSKAFKELGIRNISVNKLLK
ncbi:MAG: TerB family tellurite resistance protein [Nitrospinaceae bacterium]